MILQHSTLWNLIVQRLPGIVRCITRYTTHITHRIEHMIIMPINASLCCITVVGHREPLFSPRVSSQILAFKVLRMNGIAYMLDCELLLSRPQISSFH